MTTTSPDSTVLAAETRSVPLARRFIRASLADAGADDWSEVAELVVSELVTNAVVHAGTPVGLAVWPCRRGVRVEVADGSLRLPATRDYAATAATGRGLHMVEQLSDRWGARPRNDGKVVWFELGTSSTDGCGNGTADVAPEAAAAAEEVTVELQSVPLLMHWAWQEHAQSLLREHLLAVIVEEPLALEEHAAAGEALDVLHEQLPRPTLPVEPTALLADALEPGVTADAVVVRVPTAALDRFATLDRLLARAVEAAATGHFLAPPTQPEIADMRHWLCGEVARQVAGQPPRPWQEVVGELPLRLDRSQRLDGTDGTGGPGRSGRGRERLAALLEGDTLAVVADEEGTIVGVSQPLVAFLGHRTEADLVGHRVLVLIPERYRQAHVAGLTLHATNGRDALLGRSIRVPALRADGTEVEVGLHVEVRRLDDAHRIFVATFDVATG